MPDWRRTLYTIWVTQFLALAGFNFVVPFMPYYIQDLGITDIGEVALWSGLCSAAVSLALAVMAPIWGDLADRYGRKPMVLRATFGGAVAMTLMGFVTSAQQLLALRLLQGALTGTITASTTLVAGIVPSDRRGSALGSLQTAIFLGTTLGPLFGGVVGDAFGYRQSFWVTGALLLLSGIGVGLFVRENFQRAGALAPASTGAASTSAASTGAASTGAASTGAASTGAASAGAASTRPAAASGSPVRRGMARAGYGQALTLLFASGGALVAVFAARILLRAGTVVPNSTLALFIQSLLPSGTHAALVTGLASGASAVGGAFGAPVIGGWGDRWGHRRLLILSGLAAALLYVPQALAPSAGWLVAWQLACGFAVGGTLSTAMALLAEFTTAGHEGIVYGLDASATGLANAAGPMLGAAVAASLSLRAPFVLSTVILVAGALVVVFYVRPAAQAGAAAAARLPLSLRPFAHLRNHRPRS